MSKRPTKRGRKSRPVRPAEITSPLTPSDVLDLFRQEARPLKWPQIRGAAKVHRGPDADRLRGLLRGLCHSGELFIDSAGAYHLSESQGNVTGELERRERGAFALRSDERVIISDMRAHPTSIDFGRQRHVYDVRKKVYRGYSFAELSHP